MSSGSVYLYRANDLSYRLMLGLVATNVYYTIIYLKALSTTYSIGLFIISNIIFILGSFLCAAKVNVYDKKWTIISIVFILIQFIRILYVPEYFNESIKLTVILTLIISGLLGIASCYFSFLRISIREKHREV